MSLFSQQTHTHTHSRDNTKLFSATSQNSSFFFFGWAVRLLFIFHVHRIADDNSCVVKFGYMWMVCIFSSHIPFGDAKKWAGTHFASLLWTQHWAENLTSQNIDTPPKISVATPRPNTLRDRRVQTILRIYMVVCVRVTRAHMHNARKERHTERNEENRIKCNRSYAH